MRKSKGTLNLARTQAARADVDTFDLTVNNSADTLDVRLPGTFRLQVGVADVVAGQLAFCTFAMCYTSFILRDTMAPKHNISILPQMMRPCKYFCLTMPLWHESHVKGALSHSVIVSIFQPLAAWMMASADFSGTGS